MPTSRAIADWLNPRRADSVRMFSATISSSGRSKTVVLMPKSY
nr:MAG TPA: hypothetical protein [Caudoviricetes sp.]